MKSTFLDKNTSAPYTSGRLGFFWNNAHEIQILESCRNFIHTCVKEKRTGNLLEMTFVYGNPLFSDRRHLWGKTMNFKPRHGGLWCCLVDFNEMVSITKKDGLRPIEPMRLNLLREYLSEFELMDLSLKGAKYTWISNSRDGVITKQNIDRILVNWGWRNLYPHVVGIAMNSKDPELNGFLKEIRVPNFFIPLPFKE